MGFGKELFQRHLGAEISTSYVLKSMNEDLKYLCAKTCQGLRIAMYDSNSTQQLTQKRTYL